MDGLYADLDFGFAQRCSLEDHHHASLHRTTESTGGSQPSGRSPEDSAEALRLARSCCAAGTAQGTFEALRLVTDVLRAHGGEKAVFDALRDARENHQRVQMAAERPGPNWVLAVPCGTAEELRTEDALLAVSGRERVILDAATDGSSTMCPACGALLSRDRWQAHVENWCPALNKDEDMDIEEDMTAAIPHYLLQHQPAGAAGGAPFGGRPF